jgi:hypothetical protein
MRAGVEYDERRQAASGEWQTTMATRDEAMDERRARQTTWRGEAKRDETRRENEITRKTWKKGAIEHASFDEPLHSIEADLFIHELAANITDNIVNRRQKEEIRRVTQNVVSKAVIETEKMGARREARRVVHWTKD